MNCDLDGRVAIVTGASGGIGAAIATEMYNSGASVVITGRNIDKLNSLRDNIFAKTDVAQHQNDIKVLPLDLMAIDAHKVLVDYTVREFNRVDILVNNAGIVDLCMFLRSGEKRLNDVMRLNYTVPYNLCRETLPYMLRNKFGRIINITSIAGYTGDSAMSAYAGSKGALASATKSIAAEFGRRGITANCIAPGIIETGAENIVPEARLTELKNSIPLKRFGHPAEVAYLAVFLASDQAAYINGQQIHINGGMCR